MKATMNGSGEQVKYENIHHKIAESEVKPIKLKEQQIISTANNLETKLQEIFKNQVSINKPLLETIQLHYDNNKLKLTSSNDNIMKIINEISMIGELPQIGNHRFSAAEINVTNIETDEKEKLLYIFDSNDGVTSEYVDFNEDNKIFMENYAQILNVMNRFCHIVITNV